MATRQALIFPSQNSSQIDPYLPSDTGPNVRQLGLGIRPYITLTFATSLDSNLSLAPGTQTLLSGPESKAMTHYLRSKHDAILVGVGTAIADDPSLNCRIEGVGGYGGQDLEGQPRPVILDPKGRWKFTMGCACIALASQGKGKAPWIFTCKKPDLEQQRVLEKIGGEFIFVDEEEYGGETPWNKVFPTLHFKGIKSVMIEGGGTVINSLLNKCFYSLDSIIVTIAPTWLGKDGVQVCPDKRENSYGERVPVARLKNVKWIPLGEDVVLCGHPKLVTWEDESD